MRRLLLVLGGDVSRSLSPLLHGSAAAALGLDVAYVPVSVRDEAHFVDAVRALRTLGALGANVTNPYKAAALQVADRATPTAARIGAANTLTVCEDGTIEAENTDGPGLLTVLRALPESLFETVQILGAGGAARAAAWAVRENGARAAVVAARRRDQAEEVAALARGVARGLEPVVGATLVISSLPPDRALAEWVFETIVAPSGARVLDLAYGSLSAPSPLVACSLAHGLDALDGRDMLVEQAALALSRWTGGELSAIRAAMRRALAAASAIPPRL